MFSFFFSISLSAPRSECINTYTLSTIGLVVLPWNWNLCSLDGDVRQEAYCSYTSYNRSKNHCIALTPLVFKAFSVFLVCSSSHSLLFLSCHMQMKCIWHSYSCLYEVNSSHAEHAAEGPQDDGLSFFNTSCLQACSSWNEGWRKHK